MTEPAPPDALLVDEHIRPDGSLAQIRLAAAPAGDRVVVHGAGAPRALPLSALAAVMQRYGRPLEEALSVEVTGELAFAGGARLRRFAFRAAVDAAGRDYLWWSEPQREPVAALATSVAAALLHLAERLGATP